MIQGFSLWKTTVVVVSLILGTLYGLPNGFPDDPAVQITSNRSTERLSELDVIRAEDALKEAGIATIARDFDGSQVLIRFDSVETQIKAKSVIQAALGSDIIVALNLRRRHLSGCSHWRESDEAGSRSSWWCAFFNGSGS